MIVDGLAVGLSLQNVNFARDFNYYDLSQFANLTHSKNKEGIAIVQFNIRSLVKNRCNIEDFFNAAAHIARSNCHNGNQK